MSQFSMNTAKVKALVPELEEAKAKLINSAQAMADTFGLVGAASETEILSACAKSVHTIVEDVLVPNLNEATRITEELLVNASKVDDVTNI